MGSTWLSTGWAWSLPDRAVGYQDQAGMFLAQGRRGNDGVSTTLGLNVGQSQGAGAWLHSQTWPLRPALPDVRVSKHTGTQYRDLHRWTLESYCPLTMRTRKVNPQTALLPCLKDFPIKSHSTPAPRTLPREICTTKNKAKQQEAGKP